VNSASGGAEQQHAAMRRPVAEQLAIAAAPSGIAVGRCGGGHSRSSGDSPLLCFHGARSTFYG
ncbi:hypothetical protein A2U01_0040981, partial [Trifolium medium]|nr:hypothetical protein [Trifolium medium]